MNELDRCSKEAQDLLLTYLDRLPPGRALLGTSNLQLDLLTERFQTRFQAVKLLPPDTEELAVFLAARIAPGWRGVNGALPPVLPGQVAGRPPSPGQMPTARLHACDISAWPAWVG